MESELAEGLSGIVKPWDILAGSNLMRDRDGQRLVKSSDVNEVASEPTNVLPTVFGLFEAQLPTQKLSSIQGDGKMLLAIQVDTSHWTTRLIQYFNQLTDYKKTVTSYLVTTH